MWKVDERTVESLIGMIDGAELALPQFQRPSVWGKANWIPFLHTILLGRPTGTLLLLEASENQHLHPRKLDTAPELKDRGAKWLLLDGQQRTTTLYRAVRTGFGAADRRKKVVIDVRAALDRGEMVEDDLQLVSAQKVPGFAELAEQGKVDFGTLFDAPELAGWQHSFVEAHYGGDARSFASDLKQVAPRLTDIGSYRFPVLVIEKDTPLAVVADIFEDMNRRGQPLNKFDLMVARLYRPLDEKTYFDLRDEWVTALAEASYLQQLGIDEDDGMLPLQLIAKQVARLPADLRGRVKGLTGGDALELDPLQVIGDPNAALPNLSLKVAVDALDRAAEFLVRSCGVVAPQLLPQQAMLLPLADQFLMPERQRLGPAELKLWFFSVSLAIDYYGSVNTYADRDCNRLEHWAKHGVEPESVSALTRDMVNQLDLRMAFTREGNILGRSVMALLVLGGALDWVPGQFAIKEADSIDFHHLVPDQRLRSWYGRAEDRKPIAALTPLRSSTNRSIGTRDSRAVITELGNDAPQIMSSHQIDTELLEKAYHNKEAFESFVEDRERRLKELIIKALGL